MTPFDEIGSRYDEAFSDRAAQLALGQRLIAGLPAGARVLDHGCGSGVPTAAQLAEAGLDVLGVDASSVMLELAAERVPSATFSVGDLRELEPELGTFDAAVSFFALLMLPRNEIPGGLRALHGRLRNGGRLALGMVAGDLDNVAIPFLGTTIEVSAYPSPQLREVVTAAGFTVDSLEEVEVAAEGDRVETQQFLLATRAGC